MRRSEGVLAEALCLDKEKHSALAGPRSARLSGDDPKIQAPQESQGVCIFESSCRSNGGRWPPSGQLIR
jgi:hypothetical protein